MYSCMVGVRSVYYIMQKDQNIYKEAIGETHILSNAIHVYHFITCPTFTVDLAAIQRLPLTGATTSDESKRPWKVATNKSLSSQTAIMLFTLFKLFNVNGSLYGWFVIRHKRAQCKVQTWVLMQEGCKCLMISWYLQYFGIGFGILSNT